MSEPKLISPLLDGFSVGSALSGHDGVHCYPALKENSEEKYILKIISVPPSQSQLDALLLTGAFRRSADAVDYFRELAEIVEQEAQCLKNLARLEGFLAFDSWQTVPMEHGDKGFEVYLLSSYRLSLEQYVRRHSMTHLAALNLGIDMCNALSAARRAGWIHVDLKPSNIFISDSQEYRIGDLGLMKLDGLDLAALPGKYRSAYTAPELQDEMLSPNTTLDTYALGLILYQLYNNGQLPQVAHPTEDPLPPPANADYELSEILLKACDPSPANRWESPVEMGQALVAYMQRNAVADAPIIPPRAEIDEEAEAAASSLPVQDETLPGMNEDSAVSEADLTPEVSEMMEQADELIHHELPAPPVVPEAATVEELEAAVLKAIETEEPENADLQAMLDHLDKQDAAESEQNDALSAEADTILSQTAKKNPAEKKQKQEKPLKQKKEKPAKQKKEKNYSDLDHKRRLARLKSFLVTVCVVLVLTLICGAGYWYYTQHYIQMIDSLSVDGSENAMTVRLDTDIDEALLTVVCTDNYGNTSRQPVEMGCAEFAELLPDTLYQIRVEIEGFHRLSGSTTHEYVTPAETKIVSYTAVTGPEDGSAILNFTVDGPDSEEWTAVCTAEGADTVSSSFTGHMAVVNGLQVGTTYQIRLVPSADLYITGGDSLEFTAASIIIAEQLSVSTDGQGSLTVTWQAPEGAQVESWEVRCYSVDGYEQKLTTDQLTATFQGISSGSAYTVEVTAAGMTQPARAGITANPIYVENIRVTDTNLKNLTVSWDFTGNAPEGGWLLMYTIDGSTHAQVVQCEANSGVIEVRVPAATYNLTIQAADGSTVFQNTHSYRTPDTDVYQNAPQAFYRKAQAGHFFVNLLKTPDNASWNHTHVNQGMYTTTFAPGDGISVLMYYMKDFYIRHEDITVMYVIRDENGNVLSDYIAIENLDWRDDLWNGPNYHYCGLDMPLVPTEPGKYSLGIYFDGLVITSVEFTIAE